MTESNLVAKWSSLGPYLRSVLRIVAAFMFMQAGTTKLFAFPVGMPPDGGTANLFSEVGLGGVLEVFGGALLLLGLFTRPVAFLLAGEMAVAYFQFHFPISFWTVVNNGTSAALYCFVRFLINSPAGASTIGGTIWFSVQPANPGEVARVAFVAGGRDLGTDTTGADRFRVFLSPRDFPAGTLTLEATATGTNGGTRTKSITVTNVPDPPSTATVGAAGAVLGTLEANGAISTLTVPPGAADGATVTFTARTKAEVKTDTGVDYDALGVTFLGAQAFTSSQPIVASLAVSSGGFSPMVQPSHVVVQYAIQPNADGDGIGELAVVNTASAAPNGAVISDPVPLATAEAPPGNGAVAGLRPAPVGPTSGPPGTLVLIPCDATGRAYASNCCRKSSSSRSMRGQAESPSSSR